MPTKIELTGQTFGRLTVIGEAGRKKREVSWLCECTCGNQSEIASYALRKGLATSCGCYSRECTIARSTTHGDSYSPEFRIWGGIKTRCLNANNPAFKNYGGRGIKIVDRWLVYANFLADMGRRPSPNHTIERIDNDGNYEPDNCCWATRSEQGRNKRNVRQVTYNGTLMTISELAEVLGVRQKTLYWRYNTGNWAEDSWKRGQNPRLTSESLAGAHYERETRNSW